MQKQVKARPGLKRAATPERKRSAASATSAPAAIKALVPAKSVQSAANKFSNFTLSRFDDKTRSQQRFVAPDQAKQVDAVQKLQRQVMHENIKTLHANDTNVGMTLGLPTATLKRLCPSYNAEAGTVDLTELLTVLRQRMSGTDFYTAGAPPLIQSAEQSRLQTQVKSIIQSIKKGAPR
jgi:hypothetical protein